MNFIELTDTAARQLFGENGAAMLRVAKDVASTGSSSYVPPSLGEHESELLRQRYGLNGVAVHLLLGLWTNVKWREHEGEPSPRDGEVTRVSHWKEALSPTDSATWVHALEEAGYQHAAPVVRRAWDDGGAAGMYAGGQHAKFIAAAMAGELAQWSPDRQPHFFLDMFQWVVEGHWPCGWDDEKGRLKVF